MRQWGNILAGIEIRFQPSGTQQRTNNMIYDHLKPGDKKVSGKPLFPARPLLRGELKCNEKSRHCWLERRLRRTDPTNSRPSDKGCDTSRVSLAPVFVQVNTLHCYVILISFLEFLIPCLLLKLLIYKKSSEEICSYVDRCTLWF